MTKGQALKFLSSCDHGFLGKRKVQEIAKAFEVNIFTYTAHANPQDFKGLTLWDENGKMVDEMEGQDAHKVATQICNQLEIDYQDMFGVGSQLRECCEKIANYLHNKQKATSPEVA